jgi:hypothetical protein
MLRPNCPASQKAMGLCLSAICCVTFHITFFPEGQTRSGTGDVPESGPWKGRDFVRSIGGQAANLPRLSGLTIEPYEEYRRAYTASGPIMPS